MKPDKTILTNIFILQLFFVTLLAHSIEFRVGAWNIDEYIFATGGQKLLAGGELYRDFGDNKPPLIYYTYSLLYGLSGGNYTLFQTLSKCATIAVVFLAALMMFFIGKNLVDERLGMVSGLVYAAYTICAHNSEVLGGRTEIYATLMTAISIWFFTRNRFSFHARDLLASGFFLSLAALYNTRFGIVIAAYAVFILYKHRISITSMARIMAIALPFAVPLAVVPFYYYHNGLFDSYVFWQSTVFKYYLTAVPPYAKIAAGMLVVYFLAGIPPIVIFSVHSLIRLFREYHAPVHSSAPSMPPQVPGNSSLSSGIFAGLRRITAWSPGLEMHAFIIIMFAFMYLAFFAGGIPGVRYFYMMFIPLSLICAHGFVDVYRNVGRITTGGSLSTILKAILIVFLILPPFYFYVIHWNTQRPTIRAAAARYRSVAEYVKKNTRENDSIYVWYNVTPLYLISNRTMATSMVYPAEFLMRDYYFTGDFQHETTAWDIFFRQLDRERPAMILDESEDFTVKKESSLFFKGKNPYAEKRAEEMRRFIYGNYRYLDTIQGFRIFQRKYQKTI